MKEITFKAWGKEVTGKVSVGKRIQIVDEDGCPYATCTAVVDGLAPDEWAIKDWSENAGMLDVLIENGIVYPPHRYIRSGFVIVPICRLKEGLG